MQGKQGAGALGIIISIGRNTTSQACFIYLVHHIVKNDKKNKFRFSSLELARKYYKGDR